VLYLTHCHHHLHNPPCCQVFSVSAGSLTVLDKQGNPMTVNAPSGMALQVTPVGAPWPKLRCLIKASGSTWDLSKCAPCVKCLKGLSCSGSYYKVRLSSVAKKSALWRGSEWSDEYVFKPACEQGLTC
jgi:hypothetical protein